MAGEDQDNPVNNPVDERLASLNEALLGMKGSDSAKEILAQIKPSSTENGGENNNPAGTEKTPAPNTEKTPAGTENGTQEKTEVVKAGEEKKDDKEEELVIDSPLFGGKKVLGKKQKTETPVTLENIEQVAAFVKGKFGQEVKEMKDLAGVFASAEKWRTEASKASDLQKRVAQFEQVFKAMPEPLIEAIDTFLKGGDYEGPIKNKPKFDYSVPVDKQDTKALVNHYFPGEFTDEDFNAETPAKELKIALQSSKDKYQYESTSYETKRANSVAAATKRIEDRKASIASSVSSFRESFPDFAAESEAKLISVLESGDINSLFFNADGTYKKEAAEMLMLATEGKNVIGQFMTIAEKRGRSSELEEIVSRGSDTPKPHKGGAGQDTVSEEVLKDIREMTKGLKKSTTY